MNNYSVYYHKNLINNKYYIGITCQKPIYRWGKNGHNYKGQPKFYAAITKYGWDNFEHSIIASELTQQDALLLEAQLIKTYNSIDNGYNISAYGGVGYAKQVRCITTDKIFNSINDASQCYNIHPSSISACLHGRQITAGSLDGTRLEWIFLITDYNKDADAHARQRQNKQDNLEQSRSIWITEYCQNRLTLLEISEKYQVSKSTVSNFLRNHNIQLTPIYETRKIQVACYDKNWTLIRSFNSMTEALKFCHKTDSECSRLKLACKENWRIYQGYHWKFIDQENKNESISSL